MKGNMKKKVSKKPVKKIKKKIAKKTKRKSPRKKQQGVQAIVPISQLLAPEMTGTKFSLVKHTTFNPQQIKAIIAPTPKDVIKQRPGKGGGTWDYVPGWWFKKKLNFVFGFDGWNFDILGERMEEGFVTVKGKLIIKDQKTGRELTSKSDYGGAAIKVKGGKPMDLPNDFKAAQTDCIKRCCVQLGFAMDVYGKNEAVSSGNFDKEIKADEEQVEEAVYEEVGEDTAYVCYHKNCEKGTKITEQIHNYSRKIYGKPLCRDCQKISKPKK